MKFPVDLPKKTAIKIFEILGFSLVREGNHLIMERKNSDGTITPLVMPNHAHIKGSTLRAICTQTEISRDEFLKVYSEL